MPYKDPKVRKEKSAGYSKRYYEKNKEKVLASTQANKARGREKWDLYKSTIKCARCPEDHIACMDFHHMDPSEKEYEVSKLVSNGMYTKAYKEIKKCIVLCANCHRKHHHKEKV
jgi:hypothetical protein